MKIIITGCRGQLGKQIHEVLESVHDILALSRDALDITNKDELDCIMRAFQPEVLINAAAYTHVDEAEKETKLAYAVNGTALEHMACVCAERDVLLIHYSTDYVFGDRREGRVSPKREEDATDPLNVYGRSKLVGERRVLELHQRSIILRSGWLYGNGKNFLDTMLRLAGAGREIRVVDDQIGSPTSTRELARVTAYLLQRYESGQLDKKGAYGLYHASCRGPISWYGFAKRIFELAGSEVDLSAIDSNEYQGKTIRPKYSVLENSRLEKIWGYYMKSWEEALDEYMQERKHV